ncbi:MAG: GNAT family N-acetyltransferase [Hyphomicrobium sp.]|nr:GNAT family N-acetyltransferase [Hyphomicrobium sp.]
MSAAFRIEALSASHNRAVFDCGVDALDRYFKEQAAQDVRRRIATCFAAVEIATGTIAGYYTLAATGVALDSLAPVLAKKLPRYPVVPSALIGRLAITSTAQRQGLGAALLADAIARIIASDIGIFAILVDAKNEQAKTFYKHHGFEALPEHPMRLCLPAATAMKFIK